MLSPKGQLKHRQFGKFFFYGMTGVFITAIPLALIKYDLFLFLIAFFSYYLTFSGWRYAKNRDGIPAKVDLIISWMMQCCSLVMLGLGIYRFNFNNTEMIVLFAFGILGFILSYSDLKTYRNHNAIGKQRIANHLGAMLGATIASLTAFSVTNIPLKPQIILWLGPTVLLTPVIMWWTNKVLKSKDVYK